MSRLLDRLPSPATVIALLALFVAMGGTAYALGRNSVRSSNIVNGQVKTKDLGDGAVTNDKLATPTLSAEVRQNSTTDCTLIRGSGAVGTESNAASGFCTVNFDRNINNCVFTAGLTSNGTGYPGADHTGETWAYAADADSIGVRTANSAGAKGAEDFAVLVAC